MIAALACWVVAQPVVLGFDGARFRIVRPNRCDVISLATSRAAAESILFDDGNRVVVFDKRGLTTRIGKRVRSERLDKLPLAALFAPADIRASYAKTVGIGKPPKIQVTLLGSALIGGYLYILARWSLNGPLLDGLLRCDVSAGPGTLEPLAAFSPSTVSKATRSGGLFALGGKASWIGSVEGGWGVMSWNPVERRIESRKFGERLLAILVEPEAGLAGYCERSNYGSTQVGTVLLADGARRLVADVRGQAAWLSLSPPLVLLPNRTLHDATTGAQMELDPSQEYRTTPGGGVLVWSPADEPTSATLFDSSDWRALAQWSSLPLPTFFLLWPCSPNLWLAALFPQPLLPAGEKGLMRFAMIGLFSRI